MNPLFQRRSVRTYTSQSVLPEQIEKLMRAAMAAPSAGNQQPWEFFIARDEGARLALATASPFGLAAKHAPCVIVVCKRQSDLRFPECAPMDLSAACENILIEAVELGLGAVWMTLYPDEKRIAAAKAALGSPKNLEPFAMIAVGYPDNDTEAKGPQRYDETRIHWM